MRPEGYMTMEESMYLPSRSFYGPLGCAALMRPSFQPKRPGGGGSCKVLVVVYRTP